MSLKENLLNQIKEKKHRITKVREQILLIFTSNSKPVNAMEILKKLEDSHIIVNKTTVYREIAFLLKNKIIKEVIIDGVEKHYELAGIEHHHHLICLRCQKIKDFIPPESIKEKIRLMQQTLSKEENFKITDHTFDFYGNCAECIIN